MVHLLRIPDSPQWGMDSYAAREDLYTYSPGGRLVSVLHPLASVPTGRCTFSRVAWPVAEAMGAVIRARQCEHRGLIAPWVLEEAAAQLGVGRGPYWREAVSTAVVGGWAVPLHHGQALDVTDVLRRLASQARVMHRDLTPLWRRKVRGARVRLLDAPVTADLTLHDVVAARPHPPTTPSTAHTRIAAVLAALHPAERTVVLAWADAGVATWTEAADCAGADDPEAFGERVRRKVRRVVAEQQRRTGQRRQPPGPAREQP